MSEWPTVDEVPPLPAETLLAVLSQIGMGNSWRSKAHIVGFVGSHVGGAFLSAPEVGQWVGLSDGRTRRLLLELEAERVLWRDGGGSKRPTVYWVEVNPNVLGWLKVDWLGLKSIDIRRRLRDHHNEAHALSWAEIDEQALSAAK